MATKVTSTQCPSDSLISLYKKESKGERGVVVDLECVGFIANESQS